MLPGPSAVALPTMIRLPDGSELPPTIDGKLVARIFGCSYDALLNQVKAGCCPVEPLRLGRKLRWPTKLVLDTVGLG